MRIFINQSIFIPWKGFFDNLAKADLYVIYDSVDYSPRSFRHRNRIQTAKGPSFISIPCKKEPRGTPIRNIEISDNGWGTSCWNKIHHNYRSAPFFEEYTKEFKPIFLETTATNLSTINEIFINKICELLGIKTPIKRDTEYIFSGDKNEKLITICSKEKADIYLSGPGAEKYLDINAFNQKNIRVEFADYSSYPTYQQQFQPFSHHVSVLDMFFNLGPETHAYISH